MNYWKKISRAFRAAFASSSGHHISFSYILALSLLSLLSLIAYYSVKSAIVIRNSEAASLNQSGRQRMLTQKIAKLSLQLATNPTTRERKRIRSELRLTIEDMEKNHRLLTGAGPNSKNAVALSKKMRALYFSPPHLLDRQVRAYIATAREILEFQAKGGEKFSFRSPALKKLLELSEGNLPFQLEQLTDILQNESEKNDSDLLQLETTLFVATLIALVLIGVFIFRPLGRRINDELLVRKRTEEDLRQSIYKRWQKEEQLQRSLKEKEILMQEIHHRVKNNLQIIKSLMALQTDHSSDPMVISTLRDSQNRISAMSLVHDILYESGDLSLLSFSDFLQRLSHSVFLSYNTNNDQIALELEVDEVTLNVDQAIPCGMLVNELLTNALQHAFAPGQNGEIRVKFFENQDDSLTLQISDTGKGFPGHINFRSPESLGLTIVNLLTRQLRGDLDLERGNGSTFIVKFFPIQENVNLPGQT